MKLHITVLLFACISSITNIANATGVPFSNKKTIQGIVSYVGTEGEDVQGGVYQAQLKVKLLNSYCDGHLDMRERSILIRTGRMDGPYQHNMLNSQNAFNILMTSLLTGKFVEISEFPDCNSIHILDLYKGGVGLMQ